MKNKKSKRFSLKEQYSKSWNYIKDSRNFIYSIAGIFILFAVIGFFASVPDDISKMILDYLKELIDKTEGFGSFRMIEFIFLNNFQSSLFGIFSGVVFGILPVLVCIFNGFILGFVANMAVQEGGFGVLLNLLPHGIFEIPAIFISLGLGIKFGSFVFHSDRAERFRNYFKESLRVFLLIIIPLLIIAAIIEGLLISVGN